MCAAWQTRAEHTVSDFWKLVPGHPRHIEPRDVEAKSLEAAGLAAMVLQSLDVAFRRNRELIDFRGRFRRFQFQGRRWIAKRAPYNAAQLERDNALEVQRRLCALDRSPNSARVVPVIPVLVRAGDSGVLITPDYGTTLHESMAEVSGPRVRFLIETVLEDLLSAGIIWRGFVPRNLIVNRAADEILLLDFEELASSSAPSPPDDLTRFVWQLNWLQVSPDAGACVDQVLGRGGAVMRGAPSALDGFEAACTKLVNEAAGPETINEATTSLLPPPINSEFGSLIS